MEELIAVLEFVISSEAIILTIASVLVTLGAEKYVISDTALKYLMKSKEYAELLADASELGHDALKKIISETKKVKEEEAKAADADKEEE